MPDGGSGGVNIVVFVIIASILFFVLTIAIIVLFFIKAGKTNNTNIGPQGNQGRLGSLGPTGLPGVQGQDGLQGVQGAPSNAGSTGAVLITQNVLITGNDQNVNAFNRANNIFLISTILTYQKLTRLNFPGSIVTVLGKAIPIFPRVDIPQSRTSFFFDVVPNTQFALPDNGQANLLGFNGIGTFNNGAIPQTNNVDLVKVEVLQGTTASYFRLTYLTPNGNYYVSGQSPQFDLQFSITYVAIP